MPLDILTLDHPPASAKIDQGIRNQLSGLAAEEAVARHYREAGYQLLAHRWRGASGELDLIFARDGNLAVVEVKRGRTHDLAADHIRERQIRRIFAAAEEYLFSVHLAGCTPLPQIDLRIDLALVDSIGLVSTVEAAFFL